MVRTNFKVVGKQVIHSSKGDFYAVHICVPLTDTEKGSNGYGYKSATTIISEDEWKTIRIGKYNGFVVNTGKYTNVDFSNFVGEKAD